MAYQNVGKPRIIINIGEYLKVNGVFNCADAYLTLPVGQKYTLINSNTPFNQYDLRNAIDATAIELHNRCLAILGHEGDITASFASGNTGVIEGGIVNSGWDGSQQSGYSIARVDNYPNYIVGNLRSIIYAEIYTFPTSPDMNLSLSYEHDGVTEITTKGGSTLTNANYIRPAMWGNLGAWELDGDPKLSRSGRRVWNMSFSYMADSEVFPENYALTNENSNDTATITLLKSNTLQRAIHLTNGGQLPFIFQPNIDEKVFAICKFDQRSFNFTQKAPNIYSISLKIREIW